MCVPRTYRDQTKKNVMIEHIFKTVQDNPQIGFCSSVIHIREKLLYPLLCCCRLYVSRLHFVTADEICIDYENSLRPISAEPVYLVINSGKAAWEKTRRKFLMQISCALTHTYMHQAVCVTTHKGCWVKAWKWLICLWSRSSKHLSNVRLMSIYSRTETGHSHFASFSKIYH